MCLTRDKLWSKAAIQIWLRKEGISTIWKKGLPLFDPIWTYF